jgi:hypothetical protein
MLLRNENPAEHDSQTSQFMERVTGEGGAEYMERIPVGEALLTWVTEYSPSTALTLALYTAEPERQ